MTTTTGQSSTLKVRVYAKTEQAKERIEKIDSVINAVDKLSERRISILNAAIDNHESEYFKKRAAYFAAKAEVEREEERILNSDPVANELNRLAVRTTFAVINSVEVMQQLEGVGHFAKVPICHTVQKLASVYMTIANKATKDTRKVRAPKKTEAELLEEAQAEIEALKAQLSALSAPAE